MGARLASPTRLRVCAVEGVAVERPPGGVRPEQLGEVDALTIAVLARAGKLPADATVNVWAGKRPLRWSAGELAVGLVVWTLAGIGLWSLVT